MDRLEKYAINELGEKIVNRYGYIRLFSRWIYVGEQLKGNKVHCVETLKGLEIRQGHFRVGILQDYYLYRLLMNNFRSEEIPGNPILYKSQQQLNCPRIAVAL